MNNIDLNKLAEKAKTDDRARWRLGEILFEAEQAGKRVVLDRQNEIIIIREK